MKLSVIIVNYNVKYFLEQALHSVIKSCKNIQAEIFVVDNNSVDGSVEMIRTKFPNVKVITNTQNYGFSYANNQAIRQASGEYILLLNPDTVVEEDTFDKTTRFMDDHPEAGGLGVRMFDGSGRFLPESKRGLPTPLVAFYKICGLSALFPRSKTFGRYHLGFLDKEKTHEIEVLSGAFMLVRKKVLDQTGLLDEAFFMYGEDIDLSYRILLAGYKNYYFPDARIIHYKGESTKKSSINYVFVFYNAMIIFARKHFSTSHAKIFSFLIHLAIYVRAAIAIGNRFIRKIILPGADFILIFIGFYFLKTYWENSIKVEEGIHYPSSYIQIIVPAYILIWIASISYSGGYEKPIRLIRIWKGIFAGTLLILIIYALLPEDLRYSRGLIILGSAIAGAVTFINRFLFSSTGVKDFELYKNKKNKTVIVGHPSEGQRVLDLLEAATANIDFAGFVSPDLNGTEIKSSLGQVNQLEEIIKIHKIDEVIFCAKDISSQEIITIMSTINLPSIQFKIAPPESLYIIGSNSVDNPGDLYIIDLNRINSSVNKRNKRTFDIISSTVLLIISPLILPFIETPLGLWKNIFSVLLGKFSWVGLSDSAQNEQRKLPTLKKGILTPGEVLIKGTKDPNLMQKINILYAKDYKIVNDIHILFKGYRNLGRRF